MLYALGLVVAITGLMIGFGSNADLALRLPTILAVLVVAAGGALMGTQRATLRTLPGLWSTTDPGLLRQGVQLMHSLRIGALVGGFLAMLVGIVSFMRHVDDPAMMRSGLLMTVVGLFWGLLIAYLIALPLETRLQCRLLRAGERCRFSETPLDLLVFSIGFLFTAIYLAFTSYQF